MHSLVPLGATVESENGLRDEEGFDLYSRDMQNLIKLESSEYRVIDDETGPDGNLFLKSKRLLKKPLQWVGRKLSSPPEPGKLILLRCGQSEFNANGTFTGKMVLFNVLLLCFVF
jgi:hypothetical protein